MIDNLEFLATILKSKGYKATITTQYGAYMIGSMPFTSFHKAVDYISALPSVIKPLISL